jgi:hypothetical protein
MPTKLRKSPIMKKAIIVALATAWVVTPAIAGTNDAKNTTAQPNVQQNATSASQNGKVPGSAADKRDDTNKALGRNAEDCNKGCAA